MQAANKSKTPSRVTSDNVSHQRIGQSGNTVQQIGSTGHKLALQNSKDNLYITGQQSGHNKNKQQVHRQQNGIAKDKSRFTGTELWAQ